MEDNGKLLDLLLRPEMPDLRRERQRGQYEVTRLSKAMGEKVVFELQGLPYGRVQELQRLTENMESSILLEGCVSPNFKDPALLERYKAATPLDVIQAVLLPGEIVDLSRAVEQLTGYRMSTIKKLKN